MWIVFKINNNDNRTTLKAAGLFKYVWPFLPQDIKELIVALLICNEHYLMVVKWKLLGRHGDIDGVVLIKKERR